MSATCAYIFIPLACRSPSTFRGSSWRSGFRHFALSLFVGFHASIMRRLNDIDTKLVGAYKHQWWALIRQGFRNFISIFRKYPPIKGRVPYFGNLIWLKIASFASFSSFFCGICSGPLQKESVSRGPSPSLMKTTCPDMRIHSSWQSKAARIKVQVAF